MKVLIGIATYQRVEKLKRLLKSIYNQTYQNFDILVVCDNNDFGTYKSLEKEFPKTSFLVLDGQHYVIGCWNKIHSFAPANYGAHLTLCDDVELLPDCLEKAVKELKENFSNTDGVVGITQLYPGRENVFFQPTGQVLIGKEFIERFKKVDYRVCCNNYKQWYQDNELLEYSTKLNKFKLSKKAKLIHYHPSFYPSEMDHTHTLVRNNSVQIGDKEIYQKRLAKKLVWGESWELI